MVRMVKRATAPESPVDCYNPSTPGGLQVAATIIGVVGLLIAVISTIVGLAIWFKAEGDIIKGLLKMDLGEGRFLLGLAVILLGNIYGVLVIAFGKLFHYFRMMLHNMTEMRAQGELMIDRLSALVDAEAKVPRPGAPPRA